MSLMKIKHIVLVAVAVLAAQMACAQYYSWGADPARFKWKSASTPQARVIYPLHAEQIGLTTLYFADRLKPNISYGFTRPPLDFPFVVHPENMRSNGLVMWLPKRVEFLSTPSVDSYSMPWLKQLTAHEYRHAAQYNNLNVGIVKVLNYMLGQQSSTIGLVFLPIWMMEGDATLFETQASTFGRGKQPRFSLEYRAMGDIANRYRNIDKFFCGSYRDFIPDHYQLGYQLVAHGNEMSGKMMANEMASYRPRHPWLIVSENWSMRKLFGFNLTELFHDTFSTLNTHWNSLERVEDSSQRLPAPKAESYTTYSHPQWIEGEGILALKKDLDKPMRLVLLDEQSGQEQRLCYTGSISTRPIYDKLHRRVWWTEYRRSSLFEQKVGSTLCYLDIDEGRARTLKSSSDNILYPTPDGEGGLAWVEYAPDGIYTLHHRSKEGVERYFSLPFGEEVHSLAWDNQSKNFYCIITGDEGMWISQITPAGNLSRLTRPAYVTLSNLRAGDGALYFGSISSGKDEVHKIDLSSGKEYQISTSRYGSFDPAPADKGRVVMTTYDSLGYHLAMQDIASPLKEVSYRNKPLDYLLPKRKEWNIINLDTIDIEQTDTAALSCNPKMRRYRKLPSLFNFHSWAPLSYDPFALSEDGSINMNVGATVMTQNLLSSMQGFFSYGYSGNKGHIVKGELRYYGLGPTISLKGTYGGNQNIYPIYVYNPEKHSIELPEAPKRGKYYSLGVDISMPFLFQRGYHTRYLIASAGWNYSNGLVANTGHLKFDKGISNVATIGYAEGLHLTSFGLTFQDYVAAAHRDFAPPWGFVVSTQYALNPTSDNFSDLIALYTKIYTPGFFAHNSLTLALGYQTSIGGFKSDDALSALRFKATLLLPRGFDSSQIVNRNYMTSSLNYQFPLCYPDGGWKGIIYIKRMRVNMGLDLARYQYKAFTAEGDLNNKWRNLNSWGGDLIFDVNFLNQPASATTALKFSLYQPSQGGIYFSAGIELPF